MLRGDPGILDFPVGGIEQTAEIPQEPVGHVNKPIIQADPYTKEVTNLKNIRKSLIVSRYTAIEKAKKSNNFAILISTKVGQYDPKTAEMLKKEISRKEKNVTTISADEISTDSLNNFQEVDIFINTACPRLAIDDAAKFNNSILNFFTLKGGRWFQSNLYKNNRHLN